MNVQYANGHIRSFALSDADLIRFMNLPAQRSVVQQLRKQVRNAKLRLLASESLVVQPQAAIAANHQLFDRLFLYASPSTTAHHSTYRPLPPRLCLPTRASSTRVSV